MHTSWPAVETPSVGACRAITQATTTHRVPYRSTSVDNDDVGEDNMCDTHGTDGSETNVFCDGTRVHGSSNMTAPFTWGSKSNNLVDLGKGAPWAEGLTSSNTSTTAPSA
ncbi:hypothetical protein GUJ93_ZPchr0003g18548 [Zizania palustris]|uniref:Uncharacterized protein n=1 Tax=Zizania palustris TaxID=103762 RepID=A0A8J5SHH8_ZIZPA|nr:hypothetical protein GUJ93_ZPchr0003g18548 [Zizania palustris]